MVNTFVTSDSVVECAKILDYRRLGKQRVEAYQLWRALMGMTKGWTKHPATLMWTGHTCFLALYCNTMIDEWVARGYKNTMQKLPCCKNPRPPWWWGWDPLMMSHRASLNRKMPTYYSFDVGEYAHWGYIWPSKVPKELRRCESPPLENVCAPISDAPRTHGGRGARATTRGADATGNLGEDALNV
jgi:hypothetical protein